ncbi:MAG: response regulator transcription factor [Gemmatimonas sp.]|uniref:response regulator transcription factor n=1 Tax=Gemmatimonas sp. TaxID=1962908 RepID=UPI00391F3ADE
MALRVVLLGQLPASLPVQLAELASSMNLVAEVGATDLPAATAALVSAVPDIAVVGATFSDGSGLAFLRALPAAQRPVACIVVGVREEDAVAAFELQATDFVLWPTATARLGEALTRARQQVLQAALLRTADELQRLLGEANAIGGMSFRGVAGSRTSSASASATARVLADSRPFTGTASAPAGDPLSGGVLSGGVQRGGSARRRIAAEGATGTLVATTPWRTAGREADARPGRGRDQAEEPVLDLTREDGGRASAEGRPLRVLVREGRRTRFVPLSDIDWFEADGNYIKVRAGGTAYRTRGTITAIEAALDPRQFVRIHRRGVVNMDRVREMIPLPGGDGLLVLGDGSTLRLSRTYRARVR